RPEFALHITPILNIFFFNVIHFRYPNPVS
ncbi:unnamed protein product, partial [marine sediment metagenome]